MLQVGQHQGFVVFLELRQPFLSPRENHVRRRCGNHAPAPGLGPGGENFTGAVIRRSHEYLVRGSRDLGVYPGVQRRGHRRNERRPVRISRRLINQLLGHLAQFIFGKNRLLDFAPPSQAEPQPGNPLAHGFPGRLRRPFILIQADKAPWGLICVRSHGQESLKVTMPGYLSTTAVPAVSRQIQS